MKCPKCNYVSHDYLDSCRKCGIDLVTFKQDIGLLVLQPGMLDLSLVLGGAGADDLFESVEEEVTMHASDDDDFDISLDDYAEQPGIRRAPAGVPRTGRSETDTDLAGMDHLTLELDSSDLPAEVTARLRAAQVLSDAPPTPPTQPPAEPGAITLPGHVTLEMAPDSISSELPTAILQNIESFAPPPQGAPKPVATQDVPPLQFDETHTDFARLTPVDAPEADSVDEAEAESVDEALGVADFSGPLASLPLQDVVLAEDIPPASGEPTSEVVDPTLPTIELLDTATTFAQTDAAKFSVAEETEEATGLVHDSVELSVDDSMLSIEADEPSGSDVADIVEPAITTLDAPRPEDVGLPPSFEFELSTLSEAEAMLSDLAAPTLGEASLTLADEAMPRPLSVNELTPAAAETPPEGILTSSDMFALEDLEETMPPEHLTLELSPPALTADLASSLLEDATRTPPSAAPEMPETLTSAGTEPDLPLVEALTFEDFDDVALPGHLTLELDGSEMASEVSSIILDNLQLENPPGDVQSKTSPHDAQAADEEKLLLDLDSLELDDDGPA